MLPKNTYIVLQSFMVDELHLAKTELLVYAVIHGFSQGGDGRFVGTNEFLMEWTNASERSVRAAISSLAERGLIEKGQAIIDGTAVRTLKTTPAKTAATGKNCREGGQKLPQGAAKTAAPYIGNKDIDKDNHKDKGGRRFAPPTRGEVESYARENGYEVDADRFMAYYEGNGWKVGRNPMKDWRATVRSWHYRDHPKPKERALPDFLRAYDRKPDIVISNRPDGVRHE